MKALVTGGTGLIGKALLPALPEAVVLSRDPKRALAMQGVKAVRWNPATEFAPREALEGVHAVFNLAGEPVAGSRWSEAEKRRIHDSRVVGTRNLVEGLRSLERRPAVLVSASAVGYYGDRGDEELDETAAAGPGFLAEVCTAWEREALAAEALGIRVVCVRIGIVLARGGGALARMLPAFKLGAGGRLGDGRQWMPWIHLDDVVGLLVHAARTESVRGPLNAAAPQAVTNADFTRALGHALHRPAFFTVPRTALRLAFGEMSQVLTASQRVLPRVALQTGYRYRHPELNGALAAVLATTGQRAA